MLNDWSPGTTSEFVALMEPGAGAESEASDAAHPTPTPPRAAEGNLAAANPNTVAEASADADDDFSAGPPSSTPFQAAADAVRLIQERCEEYVTRQCGAWEPEELFEDGGIIPRLQATIEQLVDREGEEKVYRMPDGQTCKKIRELFKRTDPKTKKQEPGLLCKSFGYDTYLNHSKVLQLKESMPHLCAEIKAGRHLEHDAWAQAKRIVKANKARARAAPANVQRKRSMFQVTQEILQRMNEIGPQHHRSEALTVIATFYQDENAEKKLKTIAGQTALFDQLNAWG